MQVGAQEQCLVLIVEDDPAIAEFVESALSDEGYRVVATPSGEQGLQQVAEEQPAVILLDMLLPGMNGAAFLQQLRREHPTGIPVVLMTAAREEPAGLGLQPDGVLLKPFDLDTLLEEVTRHTGERCQSEA